MQTTSIYLNPDTWDIGPDDKGNLALCSNPYAVAQDVACACSTLLGEVWYDNTLGVPYMQQILGHQVGTNIVQYYLEREALKLGYVQSANATVVKDDKTRNSSGVITIIDANGTTSTVNL